MSKTVGPKIKEGETLSNVSEYGKSYKDWTCLKVFKVAFNIKKGDVACIMKSDKGDYSVWTCEETKDKE